MPFGPKFEEALTYAARLHATQIRKGTAVPYVSHLLAVASLVAEDGGGETEVIAALLHDSAEDQGGDATLADVRARFGDAVADIVSAVTWPKTRNAIEWRAERERAHAFFATAPLPVVRLKLADKVHNARSVVNDLRRNGPACLEKFKGGPEGTLWLYRDALRVLSARTASPLVDDLRVAVQQMHELSGVPLSE